MTDPPDAAIRAASAQHANAEKIVAGDADDAVCVNALSLTTFLDWARRTGFVYPTKWQRLAAYADDIEQVWRRLAAAGRELRRTYAWSHDAEFASLDVWRSSLSSWCLQHLIASGGGYGVRASMLAAIDDAMDDRSFGTAWEAWFRPTNAFPSLVFGATVPLMGDNAARTDYAYVAVPNRVSARGVSRISRQPFNVEEVTEPPPDLVPLAQAARHAPYVEAAALASDPFLKEIDTLYSQVAERRYRRIFTARNKRGRLVGAALAHRGPLALNFSYLENRCELLLTDTHCERVARQLVEAVHVAYDDFKPAFIPIAVKLSPPINQDAPAERWAAALGGTLMQVYSQVVYLRPGLATLRQLVASTRTPSRPSRA